MFFIIIFGIVLILSSIGLWILAFNQRTCAERLQLVDEIFQFENWRELSEEFDKVSYDKHMVYIAFGRTPPYSERIVQLINLHKGLKV